MDQVETALLLFGAAIVAIWLALSIIVYMLDKVRKAQKRTHDQIKTALMRIDNLNEEIKAVAFDGNIFIANKDIVKLYNDVELVAEVRIEKEIDK